MNLYLQAVILGKSFAKGLRRLIQRAKEEAEKDN